MDGRRHFTGEVSRRIDPRYAPRRVVRVRQTRVQTRGRAETSVERVHGGGSRVGRFRTRDGEDRRERRRPTTLLSFVVLHRARVALRKHRGWRFDRVSLARAT